jgi:hypothetical protein
VKGGVGDSGTDRTCWRAEWVATAQTPAPALWVETEIVTVAAWLGVAGLEAAVVAAAAVAACRETVGLAASATLPALRSVSLLAMVVDLAAVLIMTPDADAVGLAAIQSLDGQ